MYDLPFFYKAVYNEDCKANFELQLDFNHVFIMWIVDEWVWETKLVTGS